MEQDKETYQEPGTFRLVNRRYLGLAGMIAFMVYSSRVMKQAKAQDENLKQ